jgi:hypothetical protein
VQFGRPIGEFQAIRLKFTHMVTEIEASRQLMYFVCSELDAGRRCNKQAAMVKYFASEMSERVCSGAMQILGGGHTTHFPVDRFWRDARLTKIFEGASEIQLTDHLRPPARQGRRGAGVVRLTTGRREDPFLTAVQAETVASPRHPEPCCETGGESGFGWDEVGC